ncbi:hypothetical protein Syun_007106 [Stephania yunnanensis]|uniref:Uncharacterized protein n=1 Tax=Stephania yunnanensis TaxID=152371 RepID=A0AAP0PZ41_9MAGN
MKKSSCRIAENLEDIIVVHLEADQQILSEEKSQERYDEGLGVCLSHISRQDQVNTIGLDMDILPEKTIMDEVNERYGRMNSYEDTKDERERVEICRRETKQRRKIIDDTSRILEEMPEARLDPNVGQHAREYDRLYMEESELAFMGATLHN